MRNVKKLTTFFLIILTLTLNCDAFAVKSEAFTPDIAEIYSDGIYMVNVDTEICVYKKNETKTLPPASTTKIMTALIVLENISDLSEFVYITSDMFNEFHLGDPNKSGASVGDLNSGQSNATYLDCLYALMIYSACDAANVLAANVAGDIPSFIDMMNQKAAQIGCVNTNFGNTHGLYQKDNYSCAYDMYLITRYAYDNYPQFMQIVTEKEYYMPANTQHPEGIVLANRNKLMINSPENPYYYEFARGIKTGSYDYAHDLETGELLSGVMNLVSSATKENFTYIIVTLGAPYYDKENPAVNGNYSYKDHIALYKWAFSTLEYRMVLSQNEVLTQIPVKNGMDADRIQIKPVGDYSTLLPREINNSAIQKNITLFEQEIEAPVTKGEILGTVELKLADEVLARIDLAASDNIALMPTSVIVDRFKGILDTSWFKAMVAVVAVLIIAVVILRTVNNARRSKASRNRKIRR